MRTWTVGGLVVLAVALTLPGTGAERADTALEVRWLEALDLRSYPLGTRPPEFNARTLEDEAVSPSALQGRVVLLNFWATWCRECRAEMPAFERLHREFEPKGLTILGINVRERAEAVRRYADELKLTFPLVVDPSGDIGTRYGVVGLPTSFLIRRDGEAVALAIGPREWGSAPGRAVILALLAEPGDRRGER